MKYGYKIQDGCHNCKHVFIKYEYDSGAIYFCSLKAPKRPPCGSVAMDEYSPRFFRDRNHIKWEKWSRNREVSAWGTCNNFAKKDNPQ